MVVSDLLLIFKYYKKIEDMSHDPNQAIISVFEVSTEFPNTNKPIREYAIEVDSPSDLEDQYQEAREVWAEYQVECYYCGVVRGESHTYKEQLMAGLAS